MVTAYRLLHHLIVKSFHLMAFYFLFDWTCRCFVNAYFIVPYGFTKTKKGSVFLYIYDISLCSFWYPLVLGRLKKWNSLTSVFRFFFFDLSRQCLQFIYLLLYIENEYVSSSWFTMVYALQVLFQNDSPATLLARVMGIIGSIEQAMLAQGRETYKYFTKNHMLYERNQVWILL